MLSIICPCCGNELSQTGAIIHKPVENKDLHERHMICRSCHEKFMQYVGAGKLNAPTPHMYGVCHYSCPPEDESYTKVYYIPDAILTNAWINVRRQNGITV